MPLHKDVIFIQSADHHSENDLIKIFWLLKRYRSRSRGRSRSETPPHWKREQERLTKDIPKMDFSNRAELEARWAKGKACNFRNSLGSVSQEGSKFIRVN